MSKLRLVIIVIGLFIAVALAKNIFTLLKAEGRISDLKQRVEEEEKKRSELSSQKVEVSSSGFIEKEARDTLGLSKEGESIVVLPPQEFLKGLVKPVTDDNSIENKPNWQKWLELFFQ